MHIQDFNDIIDQIKPFLSEYLQEKGIDTSKKFSCIHPEHEDSTPSANLVGDDGHRIYCHGCGRSFDIFDAVQILEDKPRLGIEWVEETLKYLAEKYGVEVKTKDLTEEEIYEIDTYRAYRAASELIKSTEISKEENELFHQQIWKRGWNVETLKDEGVGTVLSYESFYSALKDQGFSPTFLKEVDLNRKDLFNPNNLIFTWKDERGRPIGFTARNMRYELDKADAEKEGRKYTGSKYNNQRTTGLKCNIFQQSRRLYGIDKAIKHTPPLYVFEGQADVISARAHGLYNCIAIAGSALREDHIHLLKRLGIYDVIACLDGDKIGQQKMEEILETRFAGNRDMKVRVVILPETDDPDSFIGREGIEAFRSLATYTAFEWRLNQYSEDADESEICHQMIPFIVNESSPVTRDKLCKVLCRRTGIALKAITEELHLFLDERASIKSRERRNLLDQTIHELRSNTESAEAILQKAKNNLVQLSRKHNADVLSNEEFVKSLDEQKLLEEAERSQDASYKLGEDLAELEDTFRGDWSEGTFICVGGKSNVGKSSCLAKLAYSLAIYNDVTVLYHTIDDTAQQLTPRFITIAEGSRKLTMNMVRQPNYWSKTIGIEDILERRETGYTKIRQLAQEGKLVIKELSHGSTIPFAESLISYYQDKFPERKVVYILDNFHKLRDFDGRDERVRFKALSETMKEISIRRRCCIIGSVEYTKLASGIKPTNYNLAETVQLDYDASAIIHLYSDVTDNPESFTVCHEDTDWRGEKVYLPRVEFIVGKNKITELKRTFFMDFWPACSDYKAVDQQAVLENARDMKEGRRNSLINQKNDFGMGELF